MAISKFKATCLAVLDDVRKTRQPVLVTRFGEPVAQIVPAEPAPKSAGWIGSLKGTVRITGDIVSPVVDLSDFDANR